VASLCGSKAAFAGDRPGTDGTESAALSVRQAELGADAAGGGLWRLVEGVPAFVFLNVILQNS
jgi:hypothetical protein